MQQFVMNQCIGSESDTSNYHINIQTKTEIQNENIVNLEFYTLSKITLYVVTIIFW